MKFSWMMLYKEGKWCIRKETTLITEHRIRACTITQPATVMLSVRLDSRACFGYIELDEAYRKGHIFGFLIKFKRRETKDPTFGCIELFTVGGACCSMFDGD